jgi:hypothetical protein
MRTSDVPQCACLACGKTFDAATDAESNKTPSPGDTTICLGCGHVMTFTDDLTVRELTSEEIHEVAGDPRVLALQRLRQAYTDRKKSYER